jgi:hypothetical protein
MKKHEVSYHEYDDSISFRLRFCSHLKSSEYSFSKRTKKKLFFREEKFSDQFDVEIQDVKNKELLIFLEKTNNSKTILRRSTSNEVVESVAQTLNERSKSFVESSKRLNERRRINEF